MKSFSNISKRIFLIPGFRTLFFLFIIAFVFTFTVSAQRVAILAPDKTPDSVNFVEQLGDPLSEKLRVFDNSLSHAAFSSASLSTPYNLTTEASKNIGAAIGCDFFILVRSGTQRRSSYLREEYYESFAAIYVVSSRTGRLVMWKLKSFDTDRPEKSRVLLSEAVPGLAKDISDKLSSASTTELSEPSIAAMEEVPDENSPAAKNFRAPVPFRRIKPEYTATASLYDIKATVDIVVDLDGAGKILRTEIVRWAGYGLDESAENTIRSMNWRPAERNGKSLPMRFLVRYNFIKLDKK